MLCQRMVARFGNRLGHRSIPELLGDRYQSEAIRIVASLFSLMLMFYIAGQLIGGLVMFEVLLGLDRTWALLLGIFWKGVTRTGALSGFVVGASVFVVLHAAVATTVLVSLGSKPLPASHLQQVFDA